MKTLPLFPTGLPPHALDLAGPLRRNPQCSRCQLGERTTNRCLPPAGEAGGVLTVGAHPSQLENITGKVIADGPRGANLLRSVRKHWQGPVASAYAIGCYPGPDGEDRAEPKHAASCRPYLRSYAEQITPTRILLLGELACWGVLGRAVSTRSVRRGFAWVRLPHGRVPALILMNPAQLDGRHARAAWETDLEWALTTPASFFEERLAFLEAGTYSVITNAEEAAEAARALREGGLSLVDVGGRMERCGVSWDVESRGKLHDDDFRVISAAACVKGSNEAFVWDRPACEKPEMQAELVGLLRDPAMLFIEQGSYDERAAMCYFGTPIAGDRRDVRLPRKLLDCAVPKANLDTMSEMVGMGGYKDEFAGELEAVKKQVRSWKPTQLALFDDCPDPYARKKLREIYDSKDNRLIDDGEDSYRYALVPRHRLSLYNARDCVATGLLDELLWPQIVADPGLDLLYEEVTGPASRSYARSEHWGVPMARPAIEGLIGYAKSCKAQIEPQLRAHLTPEFEKLDFGSRDQVARFFYTPRELGGLGLPVPKKTKHNKDALDKEAVDAIAHLHPCAALYQSFTAQDVPLEKGEEFLTYLRADNCVHPSYLLDGAETGRPACVRPNLFSLKSPEDCDECHGKGCAACDWYGTDEESRRIRACIAAPEDYLIAETDLSQIEMRGMAVLCDEPVLIDAYVNGRDIHQGTIDFVLEKAGKHIPRRQAKVGNFMIPYGGTDFTFATRLKLPPEEGKVIFDSIESRYPRVNAKKREMLERARRTGYTYNIWKGRVAQKRPLWNLDSRDNRQRRKAENGVFNTVVQGSYSGLLVLASHAKITEYILRENLQHLWRPVICIYDSIISVVHKSILPLAARMTEDVMTSWEIGRLPDGRVFPLQADCKAGPNLGLAKKYKPPETLVAALAESKKLGLLEARRDPRRGRMGLLTA